MGSWSKTGEATTTTGNQFKKKEKKKKKGEFGRKKLPEVWDVGTTQQSLAQSSPPTASPAGWQSSETHLISPLILHTLNSFYALILPSAFPS